MSMARQWLSWAGAAASLACGLLLLLAAARPANVETLSHARTESLVYERLRLAPTQWSPAILLRLDECRRLEQSGCTREAGRSWQDLWLMLATHEAPSDAGGTFADWASPTPQTLHRLHRLAGYSPRTFLDNELDEQALIDGLYWFVKTKALHGRKQTTKKKRFGR
jgi:hypothetical protein